MSAHLQPGREDDNDTDPTDGPGRRLRAARLDRGLEPEQIAAELHLSLTTIERLEQDDYGALPEEVFVVGYIRKYARVLALDPEPLLSAYRRAAPKTTGGWRRPRKAPRSVQQTRNGHLVMRLVGVGMVILLAALTFFWWQDRHSGETVDAGGTGTHREPALAETPDVDAETPDVDAETPDVDAETPDMDADGIQQTPRDTNSLETPIAPGFGATPSNGEDSIAPERSASEIPEAAPDTAADSEEPTTEEEAEEIVMTFEGPCWVDVRDSERNYKLFGEMKKGDRHVLGGSPPYSVILGNAAAVTIRVGGNVLDLKAISQGNVARFTLDPSELP